MKKLIFYASIVLFILGYNDANAQCPTGTDIHIANDISGSVDSREFQQSKDFVSLLGANFGSAYGTGNTETRVSISNWSAGSGRFVEYDFPSAGQNYATTIGDILSYTTSSRPFRGGTDVYTALLRAREWVNQNPVSGRNVPKVIVLLTDASCGQVASNTSSLATQIKNQGVFIVLLAIDNAASCTNLSGTNVASPGGYFNAADYATLSSQAISFINSLRDATCDPVNPPPPPPFDLTVSLSNFSITNCNTTPSASADIQVTNASDGDDFSANLQVSFYNGDPTNPSTQYLFTESFGSQTIASGGGTYTNSITNAALTSTSTLYAVVNYDGSAPGNEVPLSYSNLDNEIAVAGEGNVNNNISSPAVRNDGTGCLPFANIDTKVTNSGVGCDDKVVYTVEVCNTGSAVADNFNIEFFPPTGAILDQNVQLNNPFITTGFTGFQGSQLVNDTSNPDEYIPKVINELKDIDGDGFTDILYVASYTGSSSREIFFVKNNGNGTFQPEQSILNTTAIVSNVILLDVDNDNVQDLAYVGSGQVVWLKGNGNGTFQSGTSISLSSTGGEIISADIDQDGDNDIIMAGSTIDLIENTGSGVYLSNTQQLRNFGPVSDLETGDVNGDGRLDIAFVRNSNGRAYWMRQNANGTFAFPSQYDSAITGQSGVELVDVDNDNDLDVFIHALGGVLLYTNNGSGAFTFEQAIGTSGGGASGELVEAGDIDNDGDIDFFYGDPVGNYSYALDTGGFNYNANLPNIGAGVLDGNFKPADLDNDGDLDFVHSSWDFGTQGRVRVSFYDIATLSFPSNECVTYELTYDLSGLPANNYNYSVGVTATAQSGDDPVTFSPDKDFGTNNDLNGFDGIVQSTDNLTYSGTTVPCTTTGDQISVAVTLADDPDFCAGDFSTATVTITNASGLGLSNALLNLDLSGTDAIFNGEPYNLTNGLVLAEPNIFDPAYPSVPNALSGTSGVQSLDIFTLPDNTSTFEIDVIVGSPTTALAVDVSQLPTSVNAAGATTTASDNVSVGIQPEIALTCPASATATDTTISIPFTATGAASVTWRSGSDGTFAGGSPQVYNINDIDRANGFVEISAEAQSADSCLALASCRIDITGSVYDFGDAPLSYDFGETLLPTAAAATINPDIYLGSLAPDSESASNPTADATGDGAEEDGLNTAVIPDVKPGQTYTLTVTATNNDTTRPAYLRAFIDWNMDGDFLGDEGELSQEVIVPANSGNSSYPVEFTVPANVSSNLSDVIVRLRLSTDEFAAARTFGASANGEVEDFQIQPNVCLPLNLKVYLAGALIDNGGATGSNNEPLMRDNLRSSAITGQIGNNVIPALEPYTALAGFTHVGSGGGRSATATAFDDRGQNSVVDWVFVEFRDKNDNTTVLETMSALVQRDGDVVDIDGVSPIQLCTTETEYYVAVRHRNHFGVMTAAAEDLKLDNTVDFTDNNVGGSGVFDYGTSHPVAGSGFDYTGLAQKTLSGVKALWAGNASGDNKVKYTAPNDDGLTIFIDILSFAGNTSFVSNYDLGYGYEPGDINMDGKTKYIAPGDDRFTLFIEVLSYPLNTGFVTNFDFMLEQLPQ